jgi:hypothetical protein
MIAYEKGLVGEGAGDRVVYVFTDDLVTTERLGFAEGTALMPTIPIANSLHNGSSVEKRRMSGFGWQC